MKLYIQSLSVMCLLLSQCAPMQAAGDGKIEVFADILNNSLKMMGTEMGFVHHKKEEGVSSYLCAYNDATQQLYIVGRSDAQNSSFLVKNSEGIYEKYKVDTHGELVWMKKDAPYAIKKSDEKNKDNFILQPAQTVPKDIQAYLEPFIAGTCIEQKSPLRKSIAPKSKDAKEEKPAIEPNPEKQNPTPTDPQKNTEEKNSEPTSFFAKNKRPIFAGVLVAGIIYCSYYYWFKYKEVAARKLSASKT